MIRRIDHINISVSDLETTKRFFTELLGFEVRQEGYLEGEWMDRTVGLKDVKARFTKLVIPGTETSIELIQYFNPPGSRDAETGKANTIGFRHIAFEVENIEAVYDRLHKAGVKLFSDIQLYNEKKKLCYFYGPDDIILELAEYSE
jgi:catechol 2,3-dioxygenase-like lactoylglutathione lyase family enzyme